MGSQEIGYVDDLKTLCDLGLTLQQAKVYLALARSGQTSVKEASAAANIDRGECYRVVNQLVEKRLINKVLTSPIKYEAISFNATLKDLLKKKKEEVSSLENEMEKLLKKFKTKDKPVVPEESDTGIRFLPIASIVAEKMNRYLASVMKSIDAVMDVEWFESTQNSFYEGSISARQRGVKHRTLISGAKGTFDTERFLKYIKETGVGLRVTTQEIAAPMAIVDKNTAYVFISGNQLLKATCLVSNNERMVKLVQYYFDSLWKKSKKVV